MITIYVFIKQLYNVKIIIINAVTLIHLFLFFVDIRIKLFNKDLQKYNCHWYSPSKILFYSDIFFSGHFKLLN